MSRIGFLYLWIMLAAGAAQAAAPTIEISGLPGAEYWVWTEAEDALAGGSTATANWGDTFSYSAGNRNPDFVWDAWVSGGWVSMQFTTPAAMSNASLYLRAGANNSFSSTLLLDGNTIGSVPFTWTSTYGDSPTAMNTDPISLGALSQGNHILKLVHGGTYCDHSYDGFFIYDKGNMDPCNSVITFGDEWGPYYMCPPQSKNAPTVAAAVKPVIVFNNRTEGHAYEIKLIKDGGAALNFFSGSVIEEDGDYQLIAYVWMDSPNQRWLAAYAGANFKVGGSTSICPQGDIDGDCAVNMPDLALLAGAWLNCNDPGDPDCQ